MFKFQFIWRKVNDFPRKFKIKEKPRIRLMFYPPSQQHRNLSAIREL